MQIKVTLDNFQQTSHAELVFNEGLTIIKGLNNNGKSSLIRAINAVVFNNARKTKNYIKNGTKSCRVLIEVEGYKSILWKKTSKEVTYQIGEDTPIEKAGRLTLKDVYPDHPFTLYDNSLLFNVIAQKHKPLPFGQTSSQIFTIFEELYGILSTKEDIEKFNTQSLGYNNQLVQNNQKLEELHNKQSALLNFKRTTDKNKLLQLKEKLQNTYEILDKIQRIKSLKNMVAEYSSTPIPVNTSEFQNDVEFLRKVKKIKELKGTLEAHTVLEIPVNISIFEEYSKIKKISNLIQEQKELHIKRLKLQEEIKEMRALLPVCPTCKRPF